nr:MarR family winged helix-turn-helix transcriptional regulator [uncultured Actinoplanes sp.]
MSSVTSQPLDRADRTPFDEQEYAVVRSLSRLIYALPRVIDADMIREQRLPLSEFLVLKDLSEAPGGQLRMSTLAATTEMSLSGMTRIVGRLEEDGLVRRVRADDDARGWNAVITDAGLARLAEAWPTNIASVRRNFLDHVAGLDLKALAEALRTVAS